MNSSMPFSLIATIKQVRPELPSNKEGGQGGEPIPLNPPPNYFDHSVYYVEDIGQPTTACFLTSTQTDPKKWYAI